MDVTRVHILRPPMRPWEYYSYKDRFHALKYEVAVSIKFPKILWVAGPYKGAVSDIEIARQELLPSMKSCEVMLADKGYIGEPEHLLCPVKGATTDDDVRFNARHFRVRQLIERTNKRIKHFKCMGYEMNRKCFHIVCKLTNLTFEREPL